MNQFDNSSNMKGAIFAMITAILWGFLPIFLKVALQEIDPISIVWFRFSFAFLVLFTYYLITDRKQLYIIKRPPLLLIFAALGLAVNYIGFLKGLNYTSPSNAQIINQSGPILLTLAGMVLFKERLNTKQMLGFGVVGFGLYLFYRNQLQAFIQDPDAFNLGFFWVELGAVAWVLYAVFQKQMVQKHPAQVLNMVLFGIPALLYTPTVDFQAFQGLDFKTWAILVFLGVNTLVAYGSIALAFKYTEAYKVSIIVTLNPIITLITMSILTCLQVSWIQPEIMTIYSLIGAILVIGGVVTAVFFARQKKKEFKILKGLIKKY